MNTKEIKNEKDIKGLPDSWWFRVYLAVIVTTILVISGLWAFSRFFSK